jgi:DNA transposition AAA+ family ATPase
MKEAIARLQNLPEDAPRIGLGYGNFGLGKTKALCRIMDETNAILLRAMPIWTKKSFLAEMCRWMKLDINGDSTDKHARILQDFKVSKRILIIDEIDALLPSQKFDVLEQIRAVYDDAKIVLILVGMEEANAKLKRHRHFYSRIAEFIEFKPIAPEDVDAFCDLCDIKLENDLRDFFKQKYANLRQLRVLIYDIENAAKRNKLTSCDLKTFKNLRIEEEGKS